VKNEGNKESYHSWLPAVCAEIQTLGQAEPRREAGNWQILSEEGRTNTNGLACFGQRAQRRVATIEKSSMVISKNGRKSLSGEGGM